MNFTSWRSKFKQGGIISMVKKRIVTIIILLFIFGGFFPSLNGIVNVKYDRVEVWHSIDWPFNENDEYYEDEYGVLHVRESIQKAIINANDAATIFIHKSDDKSYQIGRNPIDIRKPLSIEGEDREHTIVESYSTSHCVFSINSDDVSIRNLTITGAYYPSDNANPIQSAIIVYDNDNVGIGTINITIVDNIIKENSNGITLISYNENPESINISNNDIVNNKLNGIIVDSGCAEIWNNSICKNNNAGISLWGGEDGNIIKANRFSLNDYGIWNDQGLDNVISYNLIENNSIGIAFWNKNKVEFCCENIVQNNHILSNNDSGMVIGYVTRNLIFNNTFEKNGECGLNLFGDCHDNTIYHNNFLENGKHWLFKKNCCNAADNDKCNKWYNLSLEEGNYWSDYSQRTNIDVDLESEDYRGTWDAIRNDASYFLPYYVKIYALNLNIYLDMVESSEDKYPWVRKNGWNPQPPEKPDIFCHTIGKQIEFKAKAIDSNDDNIKFLYQIINETGDVVFGYDWSFVDENDYWGVESGNWSILKNCGIPEPGSYCLQVKAIDIRSGDHNNKKGFDYQESRVAMENFDIL